MNGFSPRRNVEGYVEFEQGKSFNFVVLNSIPLSSAHCSRLLISIWVSMLGSIAISLRSSAKRILVGNTFRRLSAKSAGYHVFQSRQARYGNQEVGVGTKRGAELASHVFRCLIENPQHIKT